MIRRSAAALLTAALALSLTACGSRDAQGTAEKFVEAVNDGAVSEQEGLFEPAPSAEQYGVLDGLHDKCTLDKDSIRILPSGLTPQIERMVVVADCDGDKRLIGAVVSGDTSDPEPDEDYTIAPENLPGGATAGKFSRDGLPEDLASIKAM